MSESLRLTTTLPVEPRALYEAWLDGEKHGAFTGSPASVEPGVGGAFSAWEGYISGRTLELEPGARIIQSWRTTDFPAGAPDSRLDLRFEASGSGTLLTLRHTEIPAGQGEDYRQGWLEYYFEPMKKYFGGPGKPIRG